MIDDNVAQKFSNWKKTIYDKAGERRSRFTTTSDHPINPLYTRADLNDFDYIEKLGFPGEFPFTRGIQPTMYRGKIWTMRQFSGFGTAKQTNARYKYLLSCGQTGLSVAFHMPTIMGYDSDDPKSAGEVGKCGVAIDSLIDMEELFSGIPLDRITTSMTINAPAAILLAMYIACAEKQGVPDKIGGTIQNDILKEYIAQKSWIFPPKPSLRLITDTIDYCTRFVPKWNTISISGYHIREAGATAAQELAFTLADGIAYVEAGKDAGLKVEKFAPRLSFFFNSHNDFFEEIAKFRAARRMWANIMKKRFNVDDPASQKLRFHTQTAGCSLAAQQPMNNVVRVTIQALAAVLGGTQSLHTNSLDETLALPTEESATIALRTQQIIADESGVANTIDPIAGSYFVEKLTDELELEAYNYINKIDEMGGMLAAIDKNFPQSEIQRSAFLYQKQIERGDKTVIGVNKYIKENESKIPTLYIDPSVEKEQINKLKRVKSERNNKDVEDSMRRLAHSTRGNDNLMHPIIEAVKNYATVGEICNVLRREFGEYRDPGIF